MVTKVDEIIKSEGNAITSADNEFTVEAGYICTLDVDGNLDDFILAQRAANGGTTTRNVGDNVLRITHFITAPGVRSRTGEFCIDVRLICEDGTVYFTQSSGIAKSVKNIVRMCINKKTGEYISPLERGIGFKIVETELDNGNTYKYLDPVRL